MICWDTLGEELIGNSAEMIHISGETYKEFGEKALNKFVIKRQSILIGHGKKKMAAKFGFE